MSDTSGRREASTRGRPRDDERTQAILDATAELLMEHGYDKLRIQDVADQAGSGTGAIYRRWKTKEDLVAEAIRLSPDPDVVETDDPVADLRALMTSKILTIFAEPDLIPGLISAMRAHPAIADAVRSRYSVEMWRRQLARIVGEDHPHLDLLAELTPAVAIHRNAFGSTPIDSEGLADEILGLVLDVSKGR